MGLHEDNKIQGGAGLQASRKGMEYEGALQSAEKPSRAVILRPFTVILSIDSLTAGHDRRKLGPRKGSADLFFRSAAFPCPSGTSRGPEKQVRATRAESQGLTCRVSAERNEESRSDCFQGNARFFLREAQDRLRLLRMTVLPGFSAACEAPPFRVTAKLDSFSPGSRFQDFQWTLIKKREGHSCINHAVIL